MTEPRVWSVTQVNRAVRVLLEDTIESLWISGEVTNWTRARSGHCYFTLKDEQAQLRCVMFKTGAASLPADPEEGTTVRALGGLTLYEARGEYQLVVRRLEAEGAEGLWRQAFEQLRSKLEAEGLFAPERKRALPRFPEAVGVVTSLAGAALADILTVIRRRAPWTRVIVRGARVQGEGAGEEVAEAIRALGGSGLVDVLIVGRGGGSLEDLWAFNEEVVARAIVACPVPVISAVGHEVDVTISDLVADVRAPHTVSGRGNRGEGRRRVERCPGDFPHPNERGPTSHRLPPPRSARFASESTPAFQRGLGTATERGGGSGRRPHGVGDPGVGDAQESPPYRSRRQDGCTLTTGNASPRVCPPSGRGREDSAERRSVRRRRSVRPPRLGRVGAM